MTMRLPIGFCLGLLALAPHAQASDAPPPAVTVTGEATASVAPDRAVVRAGVVSQGKTAREAMSANTKQMTTVLAALKEAGIADADVQTSRVNLEQLRDNSRPPQVTGFQASNQVTVQLRDIGKVGEVLDKLVSAGTNSVSGFDFIVSDPSKALDKVRTDAIADARRKAEIYAKAAGVTLGKPIAIVEEGGAPARPMLRMAAPTAGAAVPIAVGEEQLRISVSVSFELVR